MSVRFVRYALYSGICDILHVTFHGVKLQLLCIFCKYFGLCISNHDITVMLLDHCLFYLLFLKVVSLLFREIGRACLCVEITG